MCVLCGFSSLTVCDPMDYSPPGSSVCEILQARILVEKEMATHSGILAWKNPWTEESCGLKSMGLHD